MSYYYLTGRSMQYVDTEEYVPSCIQNHAKVTLIERYSRNEATFKTGTLVLNLCCKYPLLSGFANNA